MKTSTNNQPAATEGNIPLEEYFLVMTTEEQVARIIECFHLRGHLKMVARTSITNQHVYKKTLRAKRIGSIDQIATPDADRPVLAVVLAFGVDDIMEPRECQLGHILTDPMFRIAFTALSRSKAILQCWYQFNPLPTPASALEQPMLDCNAPIEQAGKSTLTSIELLSYEGDQVENPIDELFENVTFDGAEHGEAEMPVITPEDRLHWAEQALEMMSNPSIQFDFGGVLTDTIVNALNHYSEELQSAIEIRDFDNGPKEDEDEDTWKQRVIAHDVAVMQSRGYQVVGPNEPIAPPKPARKPRPVITQAPHLTIGFVKGAFKRAVEYLRLLEMLHEGQYEYVSSEDEHTYDGKPHEGCFNCLSYYTAAHYLLDMLDRMGSMALALFDVPGREDDLVEAMQLYAWATHRIDRQERGDDYLREGQEEVLDYGAGAVDALYRCSREMWMLTPEQETNEISIELRDRLDMEFARTYLEETHRYQEWCRAYLKNKGKVPFYRF